MMRLNVQNGVVFGVLGICLINVFVNIFRIPQRGYRPRNLNNTSETTQPVARVELIQISHQFKNFVPVKSAFWNKRQHQMFQLVDLLLETSGVYIPPRCQLTDGHGSIDNFNTYPQPLKDFVRYIGCRHFPQLIDHPRKCQPEPFLLLVVKSVVGSFERRQAIRETWGKEGKVEGLEVRLVFLLGSSRGEGYGPNLKALLGFEDGLYGDLLQWDFRDTLFNLTLKDTLFLRWADTHCPGARYIFKGDDDIFLNTPALVSHLRSLNQTETSSPIYLGQSILNASPLRDLKSKYFIPSTLYEGAYPGYMGGGGFVYSGSLIKPLYAVSHYIPFFPIDDVFTGMCFLALGVSPTHHEGFRTFDIDQRHRRDPCVHRDLLLVHQRTPLEVTWLWEAVRNPELKC
ncbi:N-acetyllactosaminide beta-1,3-N-acetylglucosaminyltransferase 2 [Callorhinchus milii]|uniref:Hexosyltransferase n=1 Tax=Callorhinchus milii TaxID=7868 RepID=A0A4W3GEI5_CALMI|nr:N-acetyllactosaminide beta-1,3-N-acetylglucosaminyltransferase 2 [Callorhinchus milii]XP_042201553.1 N-acetyllactosaminide beta-1,3-N-acetylglucosaminyltransferase 2 [Callorhinchus milii]XP_042201554.1 N-acetyllactosaminide beta-1,3-N-acetylglucosaminyltransferase 2 [Callorhinchus milii]|eukprot:gi/632991873/ref/XP_007884823.1/ PREDICTED: UDP-GlcNAc:betaGal beta-1,3-N-acetylglucosaminyltransferase 2-like [Callorhinchus milii]